MQHCPTAPEGKSGRTRLRGPSSLFAKSRNRHVCTGSPKASLGTAVLSLRSISDLWADIVWGSSFCWLLAERDVAKLDDFFQSVEKRQVHLFA